MQQGEGAAGRGPGVLRPRFAQFSGNCHKPHYSQSRRMGISGLSAGGIG